MSCRISGGTNGKISSQILKISLAWDRGAERTEGKTEFGQYFRQRQYLPPPCGASARHGKIKKKLKAGTALFLLGDADDSPGLSFIGFTLAVLLIMRGIAYTGRIRQGFCG